VQHQLSQTSMALFGKKKEAVAETKTATPKAQVPAKPSLATDVDHSSVIKGIRISEKSVNMSENNVYTFNIRKDANKHMVKSAVKALYNVTPVKVNIVNKKPVKRTKGLSGKMVHHKGMKKAYVYLKKGETITVV